MNSSKRLFLVYRVKTSLTVGIGKLQPSTDKHCGFLLFQAKERDGSLPSTQEQSDDTGSNVQRSRTLQTLRQEATGPTMLRGQSSQVRTCKWQCPRQRKWGCSIQPTRTFVMGFITYDVKGNGATQKIAKRPLDTISVNVASYARCLSNPGGNEGHECYHCWRCGSFCRHGIQQEETNGGCG
jgi:hypothetical protein